MEFEQFNCRICGGKLVPRLNELVCNNCNFKQHPMEEKNIGISSENLKRKLDNKESILILDVREKWEYGMTKIANSLSIPIRELKNRLNELDKSRSIVVVCHFGDRSGYATRYLLQNGFGNVKNLEGGIDAWSNKIDNSVRRY